MREKLLDAIRQYPGLTAYELAILLEIPVETNASGYRLGHVYAALYHAHRDGLCRREQERLPIVRGPYDKVWRYYPV